VKVLIASIVALTMIQTNNLINYKQKIISKIIKIKKYVWFIMQAIGNRNQIIHLLSNN
jgi:hypothetical protein